MVVNNWEFQNLEKPDLIEEAGSSINSEENLVQEFHVGSSKFHSHHEDCMELYASKTQVVDYLNSHSSWFIRCAEPMQVKSLGKNGYALVIGQFGAFGYEVEPKIGLELLAPSENNYHIRTIPIPDYQAPGYDVDYNAYLHLVEDRPGLTMVEWQLDLAVELHFPKFIRRLPHSLIQSTGDRLLHKIVRQVSRRLTKKVQEDFHRSLNIPFPVKSKKRLFSH
ncbi:MAG: DUF1997 domain-containing protein [Sphaerospermopsis sp. SIO1G2]|nr:DUF1997 domain-containing protein [Sphaerospermopsis sp. SIO1G1]NET73000.1 DUF1997 domain-containing protein [Sphaerospermopsis sp. SIO1G2]